VTCQSYLLYVHFQRCYKVGHPGLHHIWGNSLNQPRRGGNRLTMVMMFVGRLLGWQCRRHVGDMSATCRPDSQKSANLADRPSTSRHKFVPDTFFCVGDCQLSPNFLHVPEYVCTHNLPKTSTYNVGLSCLQYDRAVVDNNNTQQPT